MDLAVRGGHEGTKDAERFLEFGEPAVTLGAANLTGESPESWKLPHCNGQVSEVPAEILNPCHRDASAGQAKACAVVLELR